MTRCKPNRTIISMIVLAARSDYLAMCMASLSKQRGVRFEIIVVMNGCSKIDADSVARTYRSARVVWSPTNLGYAGGNNLGALHSCGEFLAFLNDDAFPDSEWLWNMLQVARSSRAGIIASVVLSARTGHIESAGGTIEFPLGFAPALTKFGDTPSEVAYASGAAFMIRRDLFLLLGGFDRDYFCYHEETDLCWRARLQGYKIVIAPKAHLRHLGGSTTKQFLTQRSYLYLMTRNRIATNIKNLGARSLLEWFASEGVQALTISVGAIGRLGSATYLVAYWKGVSWNVVNLGRTFVKRAFVQGNRKVTDAEIILLHTRTPVLRHLRKLMMKLRM